MTKPLKSAPIVLHLLSRDCRHGARSPLTKRYWAGQTWDVCGKSFEPVAIEISSLDGGEQPKSDHDQAQVRVNLSHHATTVHEAISLSSLSVVPFPLQRNIKLPGGCHKGELTKLGQQQAHEVGEWLRSRYIHQLGFLPDQYKVPTEACVYLLTPYCASLLPANASTALGIISQAAYHQLVVHYQPLKSSIDAGHFMPVCTTHFCTSL